MWLPTQRGLLVQWCQLDLQFLKGFVMAIANSISDQILTSTSTPQFNNATSLLQNIATAGGTTTLTSSSAQVTVFTGSLTQTLVLPVVSTLSLGWTYKIVNLSSGSVTVQSSGLNTIQVMDANSAINLACISTSGTGIASWLSQYAPSVPFSFPLAPNLGGSGIANSALNTLTIGAASSINQNVSTAGSPVFVAVSPGNFNLATNTLSSTNSNGNISLIPNGSGANLFRTTSTFVPAAIGPASYASANQGLLPFASLRLGSGAPSAAYMGFSTSSATQGVFSAITNGSPICRIVGYADDGTSFVESGLMQWIAINTISTGVVPCTWNLYTSSSLGVRTLALSISEAQVMSLANALLPASGGTGTAVAPSAGQIPIGTSGNVYTPAAINSGTGIIVANGSGSITVSATGGGLGFATISGTTQTAVVLTRYLALNAGQTTLTLPSTYAVGDIVALIGSTANTGGWIIQASAGDTVRVNNSTTSAGGTVTCTAVAGQCIELVCDVANTSWVMTSTSSVLLTTA